MATATASSVIPTRISCSRRVMGEAGGSSGWAARIIADLSTSLLILTSMSDIAVSARGQSKHDAGQHDHINRKNEQRWVPDMTQQAEPGGAPAQRDCHDPCRDHHQRDRRDIDAEQVYVSEPHRAAAL